MVLFAIAIGLWGANAAQSTYIGQLVVTAVIIVYLFCVLFIVGDFGIRGRPLKFSLPYNVHHLVGFRTLLPNTGLNTRGSAIEAMSSC